MQNLAVKEIILLASLCLKNSHAGFVVRIADIRQHPPREARNETLFKARDGLGRPVTRDNDLFVVLVEVVEGVEKLFLCAFLGRDELDIIQEEDIHVAIAAFKILSLSAAHRINELVGESFASDVEDIGPGVLGVNVGSDSSKQVSFSEADAPVDKKRVVSFTWLFNHSLSRCMSKLV